jgi:hypothetical protein
VKKKQIYVAVVLAAFLSIVGCSESDESNAINAQPSYSAEEQAYIDEILKTGGYSIDEYQDVIKKCNVDLQNPTKESADCLIKNTNKKENTTSLKIASCKRATYLYIPFAIMRDSGTSIEDARLNGNDSLKNVSNKSKNAGVPFNEDSAYKDLEKVINVVYSRPYDSPAKIHKDMYISCINN